MSVTPAPSATPALLREAGPFDLSALAALHAACFSERWDAATMAGLLATPGSFALIAIEDDRPAGFVMVRAAGGEAEVITIAVDPARRRRRLGARLLEGACERLGRCGARTLFLEVAEDDAGARRFYGLAGFGPVGRRRGYYRRAGGRRADALVLSRPLRGGENPAGGDCGDEQQAGHRR